MWKHLNNKAEGRLKFHLFVLLIYHIHICFFVVFDLTEFCKSIYVCNEVSPIGSAWNFLVSLHNKYCFMAAKQWLLCNKTAEHTKNGQISFCQARLFRPEWLWSRKGLHIYVLTWGQHDQYQIGINLIPAIFDDHSSAVILFSTFQVQYLECINSWTYVSQRNYHLELASISYKFLLRIFLKDEPNDHIDIHLIHPSLSGSRNQSYSLLQR